MAWILAVDDEEGIRNLIQNALEKDGHRVSVCKNTEVIKEKDLIHYDLILLDIMMPGTDGITWCKKIRRYVDCPILFLTAKAEEKSIMEGLGSVEMIISVSRLESENSGQGLRHICEEKPEKKHMQWKFQEYVLIWRERVFRWGKRKFL